MKALLFELLRAKRNFLVYCVIGVTGVTLDYGSFWIMANWCCMHYLLANAIGTSLGIINNFFLNCAFNFKVRDRLIARFLAFYGVGLLGMAISCGLLYVFVSGLRCNANYAKLFTIIIIVLVQYNLNRLVSFRK